MDPVTTETPSHLLDHAATLHADLRAAHTPHKRARAQARRYHNSRAPILSAALVSQPYYHAPPGLASNAWPVTVKLTLDALIAHPETTIRTWTKRDRYRESLRPEVYWPKRPPHHYGGCRMCHDSWPHDKKGRRTMMRLRREGIAEGLREWREGWGRGDDGRTCEHCEMVAFWYYGEGVGWGEDGRAVILRGIDTEGLGGDGAVGEGGVSDDDRQEWDMLDGESEGWSETGEEWEVLGGDDGWGTG